MFLLTTSSGDQGYWVSSMISASTLLAKVNAIFVAGARNQELYSWIVEHHCNNMQIQV
jgi:hypothetical protein